MPQMPRDAIEVYDGENWVSVTNVIDITVDRIEKLEEKLEKVIQCLKDWDGTGHTALSNLREGLNWDALQISKKGNRIREHKRKITLRKESYDMSVCLKKELEELEAIADTECS